MEKGKILRLLLIPLTIGLVVTLIVRQVLSSDAPAAATDQGVLIPVVAVAGKEPVKPRTKLTEGHLQVKQVPKAFLTGAEFRAVEDLSGQITLVALEPGEIILRSRVVPEGQGALPYRIPAGKRAMTIRIDELNGVAGHPEPGDLVDLVLVLPAKTPDRPAATSRILYEAVQVLAKGPAESVIKQTGGPETAKLTSLTVALAPEEAVEVALAEQIGLVKVLLRPALPEKDAGEVIMSENRYLPAAQGAPKR